ncbi:MAG: molecular chaperone HtpG [Proteobacteria bacterium]|nr:molecular chaperone HtpG [Pseudomonadota bacterium]
MTNQTDKKASKTANKTEQHNFDVEVGKVLNLMINSLYTNKDVALRELISNASDACDKLRYLAAQQPDLLKDEELKISIATDNKAKTLTISDNGIGMSHEDLIQNLGTIAKSGTENFVKSLTGDKAKDVQLIGQFGVGFYSAFMIASKVEVLSKKAGEKKAYSWQSQGSGSFEISETNAIKDHGTKIILHLKDDAEEFLDQFHIKHVVKTYSDHINIKIEFVNEEGKAETINSASALWTKPQSEISEEDYQAFYKHISHLPDKPLMTIHNKAEGILEYINLLFIPSMKPFDLFHPDRKGSVKLYVKKVYISEDLNLVPAWLRFMRGLVDSQDLPLNISRETLQHNLVLEKIKKAIIKKTLSELKKKANSDEETYSKFWNNFGAVLKEGLCESHEFKDQILEIGRFYSSKSPDKLISLAQYLERIKDGQDKIYYITGESVDKIKSSPQLEGFASKDIEVLFLTDAVDDFWVTTSNTYQEKEFQSVNRADIDLENIGKTDKKDDKKEDKADEAKDVTNSELDGLVTLVKEVLGEKIKDVRISKKLTDSPVCLAVDAGAMDIRLEKYLKDQKQIQSGSAKILEINPNHIIIKSLNKNLTNQDKVEDVKEAAKTLFDQACIIEGESIEDVKDFSIRLGKLLSNNFKA